MTKPAAQTERRRGRPRGPVRDRSGEIAAAGLELFARRGFAATTIQDIGRAAGVNTALIYYYYRNKEHLFSSALEHVLNRALDGYADLTAEKKDPRSLIDAWLEANRGASTQLSEFLVLTGEYRRSGLRSPEIDAMIARFYEVEVRIIAEAIGQGVEEGTFAQVDPARTALWVSTHLDGIFISQLVRPAFDVGAAIAELRHAIYERLDPAIKR